MIRTALYVRVSTNRQAKEGDSIPAQLSALREYVNNNDKCINVGEYIDDGVSGTKNDREELQRLLNDVKEDKIDKIIFVKLDRWFRSIKHYINTQDILEKHHCDWLAIWEPIYDSSTPQGRMIINTMMNLAQFEAENTGARIKQVFAYKAEQGEVLSGKTPIGYSIVDKRLTPNADADFAREIFAYYDRTNSLRQTALFMSARGVMLAPRSVKHMLSNKKYIGINRDNPEFCEPIIDRELFDRVQIALSRNIKLNSKHEYIFQGLIYCPECKKKLSAYYRERRQRGRKTAYAEVIYRCPRHYCNPHKPCSFSGQVSEKRVERWLLNNVNTLIDNLIVEQKQKQSEGRRNAQKAQTLTRKLDRLKEAYLNEIITLSEYREDRERITAEIAALNASEPPKTVLNPSINKVFASDFKTVYDGLTAPEKRRLWRSVLEKITIDEKRDLHAVFL